MQQFKKILTFVGTESNETAMRRSVDLAVKNVANLTLMDVVKPLPRAISLITSAAKAEELEQLVAKDHERKLRELANRYADTGVRIDVKVAVGDAAMEIVREVIANGHDLVIKTASKTSAAGGLFGSVAKSLLRLCPCPVWLLKPEVFGEFDRVLAAIDVESEDPQHGELNRKILETAYAISQRSSARLHVVSAWQLWMEASLRTHAGDEAVEAMMAEHKRKVDLELTELLRTSGDDTSEVRVHAQYGPPAAVIQSIAEAVEADLLVMGTVCRTGAAGFLIGNTAETVVSNIRCSLLALKPSDFVSPVQLSSPSDDPLPLI